MWNFKKVISTNFVPSVVQNEILRPRTPPDIQFNFNRFINLDYVEVKSMLVGSREHKLFNKIKSNYKFMGEGEAAVVALTCENGGIIASNNLSDVRAFVEDYDLNFVTTVFVLAKAYEDDIKSRKELDEIWKNMLKNGRRRSLPKNIKSFTEYYGDKYVDDLLYMGIN